MGNDKSRGRARAWWLHPIHLTRGSALIALVVVFAMLGVLTFGYTRLNDLYNKREADMAEARISGCIRFNLNQQDARVGQVAGFVKVITSFPGVQPEITATVRTAAELAAAKSFRYRKCTEAEIANSLENPPADPAEGCRGDGKGYCVEGSP